MNRTTRTTAMLLTAAIFLALAIPAGAATEDGGYVCPPCGDAHDAKVYDEPGNCPVCGMKLVKKAGLNDGQNSNNRRNVAILIFDGVQIIDYTGPYEVFGQGGIFDVFTVSETGATLTTSMGMSVNPAYSFANAPKPDILILPGGNVAEPTGSAKTIEWVRGVEKDASYVMSVCNGAFILAKAGLLDGKSATTFYGLIDGLKQAAPKTHVVSDQRWVDNGKVLTTAGLSSGIDGSLHLIAKIRGEARAKMVALHMEYNWDPESKFARAALADMRFPEISAPERTKLNILSTDGDRETWTRRYEAKGTLPAGELADSLKHQVDDQAGWKPAASKSDLENTWTTVDEDGAAWRFTAGVTGAGTDSDPAVVTLHIEKAARIGASGVH